MEKFTELTEKEAFKKYVEALTAPFMITDPKKWPIRAGRAKSLFKEEFATTIRKYFSEIKNKQIPIQSVADAFESPTRIWRLTYHILGTLKKTGVPKQEIREIMLYLIKMISLLKSDDVFNTTGCNLILTTQEIKKAEQDLKAADLQTSREIHNLFGLLWTYAECIYFVAHEAVVEIHGPYHKSLVVREYKNLSPTDLWSDLNIFPYKHLKITTLYNDIELEFDVYNNSQLKKGDLVNCLKSYKIEADGKRLETKEISRLSGWLAKQTYEMVKKVDSWNEKQQAKKYADIFWYILKPLADLLGEDWHVPQIVYEKIERGELPPKKTQSPSKEEVIDMLKIPE
ncbi:MAG: hypothetical protein GTN36_01675 [Candidatus Aenigmarchaeota archaeon]|nr:hypothetical protein [Candidatus Aenigmarchaeota archaeon]